MIYIKTREASRLNPFLFSTRAPPSSAWLIRFVSNKNLSMFITMFTTRTLPINLTLPHRPRPRCSVRAIFGRRIAGVHFFRVTLQISRTLGLLSYPIAATTMLFSPHDPLSLHMW